MHVLQNKNTNYKGSVPLRRTWLELSDSVFYMGWIFQVVISFIEYSFFLLKNDINTFYELYYHYWNLIT